MEDFEQGSDIFAIFLESDLCGFWMESGLEE